MDASVNHDKMQRTLASQPAAAEHFRGQILETAMAPEATRIAAVAIVGGVPRSRLERVLLAARQMQQR